MRALTPLCPDPPAATAGAISAFRATDAYADLVRYFDGYPARSLMYGPHSRAILYTLTRALRPRVMVEVGTLFAGTTEAFARALWENGRGEIHTTDPFGGERCPPIIGSWPAELKAVTHFYPLNSMAFFDEFQRRQMPLDLVLVDGNHDYEFALFDLQMAARCLSPGGVIVMDNSDQSGPFYAARAFLAHNPTWREIGSAVADHDPAKPFDAGRSSTPPETNFVLLQAPDDLVVSEAPRTWGPFLTIEQPCVSGLALDLAPQDTAGRLHYRIYGRVFADQNRYVAEYSTIGHIPLSVSAGGPAKHAFKEPLALPLPPQLTEIKMFGEIELSWQADVGRPQLRLTTAPSLIGG